MTPDVLQLGPARFAPGQLVVMAIVNRTTDSFYDQGATFALDKARERVHRAVAEGADFVDIGGIKAAVGEEVGVAEEIRRTAGFVGWVRTEYPALPISVDTWRHEVGRAACEAGADVLNDAWGGSDPRLVEVAAEFGASIVCTHAGGAVPRSRPHRVAYPDVMADVVTRCLVLAQRAVEVGVDPSRVIVDPGHDFAKNTYHSLEVTRRIGELVATGWPVLASLSNKDFVGETLDRPVGERLLGTLAATAVCAWEGVRIFRAHNVAETREVLDMVAAIRGTAPPRRAVRGLA